MDLSCPFCQTALPPAATACQSCGSVLSRANLRPQDELDKPTTTTAAVPRDAPKKLPPAGNQHSRELRDKLANESDPARDKALGALGHLVRPGRVKWPWPDAPRDSVAGKQRPTRPPKPPQPARKAIGDDDQFKRELTTALQRTPAWAVSAVLHLVLIVIFALITLGAVPPKPKIVLIRGATVAQAHELLPELPKAGNTDLFQDLANFKPAPEIPSELVDALAESADASQRPSVRRAEKTPIGAAASKYGWRGHGGRRYAAATAGGTWGSEKAVDRGLRWLADHQLQPGWWGYHEGINGYTAPQASARVGLTGLALLAFLGAGNTSTHGKYAANVKKGLDWLSEHQSDRGKIATGNDNDDQRHLYHQAIATLALCEAVGMGDQNYRSVARGAASYLAWAQNADGGWRYFPRTSHSDSSVTGWGVMAMSAARAAGIRNVDESLQRARAFLDSLTDKTGDVGYVRPEPNLLALTAVGLLCKHLCGALPDDPMMVAAAQRVVEPMPSWDVGQLSKDGTRRIAPVFRPKNNPVNFYRWYYTSIGLIHRNDENWRRWNPSCRDNLVGHQRAGHTDVAGSWDPQGVWCSGGGRVYSTAMAVLTLEVYYRAAPAFLAVPDDPLTALSKRSPFYGQELIERAMDAAEVARTAVANEPSRAHALLAAADGALSRFRAWARVHLAQKQVDGRTDVEGWQRLADREAGEIALMRGKRTEALSLLAPALIRDPDGPDAARVRKLVIRTLLEAARDQRQDGQPAARELATTYEARAARLIEDLLNRGEATDADHGRALRTLAGDLQARGGNDEAAAASYRRALADAEGELADGLRKKLAARQLKMQDWKGALETLGVLGATGADVSTLDPVVASNAAAALAERIRLEGDPRAAAAIYREAIKRFGADPATSVVMPGLRRGLAESLSDAEEWTEAAKIWLELADGGYGNAARLKAAHAMARGSRSAEALKIAAELQGVLAPFSDPWWEARCIYAEALFAEGDYQECYELVRGTKLLYPNLGGDETRPRFTRLLVKCRAFGAGPTLKRPGQKSEKR